MSADCELSVQGYLQQLDLLTYLFTCALVPHGPGRASPGNVRSGMSRSHQYRIHPLSHLAAWSIWFALRVRYDALKVSLLSTVFTLASIQFQSSITGMLKKFTLWSSLSCFQVVGISCASCCSRSVLRFLKPCSVVKPASPMEDFMGHGHVRLVPPLTQCL